MREVEKKDALTELVNVVSSQTSNQNPNNGSVSTPSGEKVELGFNSYIKETSRKILGIISRRKTQEREVLEQINRKS